MPPLIQDEDGTAAAECPDCGCPLETHQPDPQRPSRLLATCPCGEWFQVSPSGQLTRVEPPDE